MARAFFSKWSFCVLETRKIVSCSVKELQQRQSAMCLPIVHFPASVKCKYSWLIVDNVTRWCANETLLLIIRDSSLHAGELHVIFPEAISHYESKWKWIYWREVKGSTHLYHSEAVQPIEEGWRWKSREITIHPSSWLNWLIAQLITHILNKARQKKITSLIRGHNLANAGQKSHSRILLIVYSHILWLAN